QKGGSTLGWKYLTTFVKRRAVNYNKFISKPEASRKSCSRLSPYLAYGNLSLKQIFQATEDFKDNNRFINPLQNFQSRLWWRSHYIQKLETEYQIANRCINIGFELQIRNGQETHELAFYEGATGFPMVDASIVCLKKTGFINFRMRAMLATFFCFSLWLDWRKLATFLSKVFLDYEPGIHFPQLQMHAGTTGYHTLRIYNPTAQSIKHDPDGYFVKKWIPKLKNVPTPLIYEPWKMTAIEEGFYRCKIGRDYPYPIINFDEATRKHKHIYWQFRNTKQVLNNLPKVWEKHCLPENITYYKKLMSKKIEI
ncbi:MAG: FAD-binding domain-containing protein, partial [Bacteroidota bacterium]